MDDRLKSRNIDLVYEGDLNKLIEFHLGRPWCLQQESLDSQNTLRFFEVIPDPEASAKVQEWLASPAPEFNFWGRDEVVDTDTLLSELCNRGLLPEGDLHAHIWW